MGKLIKMIPVVGQAYSFIDPVKLGSNLTDPV